MSLEFIPAARPLIGAEERAAVDAVLAGGMVVQGPQVAAFEEEFATTMDDDALQGIETIGDAVDAICNAC